MNLEQRIRESIIEHDFEWYKAIQNEFASYSGYDSINATLEIEGEIEEDVPVKFGKDNEPIDFVTQRSYQYVTISLNHYCWGINNSKYTSEYIVLKRTFDSIMSVVEDAVMQTGDTSLKYEIIKYTLILVKTQVLNLYLDDSSFSYRSLMNGFYNKLRFEINTQYPNIEWIYRNFIHKTPSSELIPEKVLKQKPKQLKVQFFESFIDFTDEEHTPIINMESRTDAEKELLSKKFYNFYKNPQSKSRYDFRIDFQWDAPIVGYLLSKISSTSSKFKLEYFESSECFFLKGKKITAGSIATAKTRFLSYSSFRVMKDYLDDQFVS